jgi:hypothetical protein
MDAKKIVSWLLLLLGEALIITAFILLGGNLTDRILALNIVVSSIIYGLFFVDILVPWIDFKDKSQKRVGSMGIRWLVTWLYAAAAIIVMLAANVVYDLLFSTQLLLHGVLLFLLFLGLLASLHAKNKVNELYHTETASRNGIVEMKKAMQSLKNKISETANLPNHFIQRINELEEKLRFISPTENAEAHELEYSFIETVHAIRFALTDYSLNEEQIENNLKKCDRLYQNRKQIYSH